MTTGKTFAASDPSHVYVKAGAGGGSPLIIFDPYGFTPATITTITDGNPPPTTSTIWTLTTYVAQENLISLTAKDDHTATSTQTADTLNPKMDLYVGEQPGGTVTLDLTAQETTHAADSNVTWAITGNGASPASGNFGKAPVIILTPGDLNYVLKAIYLTTTLEIDVHVLDLTASTEASGNVPGTDLPKAAQQTIGAYELMKITLHAVAGNTPGNYALSIPGNIAVWQNQNLTDPVYGGIPLPANSDRTLWVQGVQAGEGIIDAFWSPGLQVAGDDNQGVINADAMKVTAFGWSGPEDVPGGGKYSYAAWDLPTRSRWSYGHQATSITSISTAPTGAVADVQWLNTATIGHVGLRVNSNYTWEMDVNIVDVNVVSSSMSYSPGGPEQFIAGSSLIVSSGNGPAVNVDATASATGPIVNGVMRGVNYIKLGLIQDGQFLQRNAVYANSLLTNTLQGPNFYLDDFVATNGSWYSTGNDFGRSYNFSPDSAAAISNMAFHIDDTPGLQGTDPDKMAGVQRFNLTLCFRDFFCASTSINLLGASSVYVPYVEGDWTFNGTGNVTAGKWKSDGAGDYGDSALSEVDNTLVTKLEPTVNQLLPTGKWN